MLPYIWFSYFWSKETMSINFIYRMYWHTTTISAEKRDQIYNQLKNFLSIICLTLKIKKFAFISSLSSLHFFILFRFFSSFGFPVKINSFFSFLRGTISFYFVSNASFFLSLGSPILVKVCSFFFVSYFRICFLVAQFRLLTLPFSFSLGPSALSVLRYFSF